MLVVALQHWLLPDGGLDPRARLAPHIARIVECATACGDGATAVVCRNHESRRRCSGRIGVATRADTIAWSCSACDEAGVITGWRGTHWDLSAVDIGPDDDELAVYFALDELRGARDLDLDATLRAVLAGAVVVEAMHAFVTLTETELIALMHAVVNAASGGRTRRRLDRAAGRIEQVRLAHQLVRRAQAH